MSMYKLTDTLSVSAQITPQDIPQLAEQALRPSCAIDLMVSRRSRPPWKPSKSPAIVRGCYSFVTR